MLTLRSRGIDARDRRALALDDRDQLVDLQEAGGGHRGGGEQEDQDRAERGPLEQAAAGARGLFVVGGAHRAGERVRESQAATVTSGVRREGAMPYDIVSPPIRLTPAARPSVGPPDGL